MAQQRLRPGAEECLAELENDAGPAELAERIRRAAVRAHDGAVGQRVAGAVVVADHDLEAELLGVRDLIDGGYSAVDGQNEAAAVVREPGQCLPANAVALVEAARQVPRDVGAELAQREHGERGGADAVGVVVAVHADPGAGLDRGGDRLDRLPHVAEQERIVAGQRAVEEPARAVDAAVSSPHEHGRRDVVDLERGGELIDIAMRARGELPGSGGHRAAEGTAAAGRNPSIELLENSLETS